MAKLVIKREKLPVLNQYLTRHKIDADYGFGGEYGNVGGNAEMIIENGTLSLRDAIEIDTRSADIFQYPLYYEIAISDIDNDIPDGVSWGTYPDDQEPPVLQNRKWSDLEISAENATHKVVFWQLANSGQFLYKDVNILTDAGVNVLPRGPYDILINKDYSDTEDPEYTETETIINVNKFWDSSAYNDWLHAQLTIEELYETKGIDEDDQWDNCNDDEKIILVKWHVVGLNRAAEVYAGGTELQMTRAALRDYAEMDINIVVALSNRFRDWNRSVKTLLSNSGKTKFYIDYEAVMKQNYIGDYRRVNVVVPCSLITLNDSFATWDAGDFVGTLSPALISGMLNKVLTSKKY